MAYLSFIPMILFLKFSADCPLLSVAVFVGSFVLNFFLGVLNITMLVIGGKYILEKDCEELAQRSRKGSDNSFHFYRNDFLR